MQLSEKRLGDTAALAVVSGRIDLANADEFRDKLASAQSGAKTLVVDMAGVEYISSAGLRALMIAFKQGKAEGKTFAVAALAPLVKEIFTISRFNLVFPLFETVRDALQAQAPSALAAFDKR